MTLVTSSEICLGAKIFYGEIQFVDDVISSYSGVSAALLETSFYVIFLHVSKVVLACYLKYHESSIRNYYFLNMSGETLSGCQDLPLLSIRYHLDFKLSPRSLCSMFFF